MKNHLVKTFMNAAALKAMGQNIKLARILRGYTVSILAYYAGVSRSLVYKIESGDPTVSIGAYYAVLLQLGLEQDLATIAFRKGLSWDELNSLPPSYFRKAWGRCK